jgi:hypothetical protein
MHASPIIIVGLGAFAAQALAGGIDTVVDTTVITVSTSCASITSSSRHSIISRLSYLEQTR